MHAKGLGAHANFTTTHESQVHQGSDFFRRLESDAYVPRFSTVAGERGAADAERDIRGFALKFYTEEGNWDIVRKQYSSLFLPRSSPLL